MITINVKGWLILLCLATLAFAAGDTLLQLGLYVIAVPTAQFAVFGFFFGLTLGYLSALRTIANRRYQRGVRKLRDERSADQAW